MELSSELLSELVDRYQLGPVGSWAQTAWGENYAVETADGRFFLKKHRHCCAERLDSIQRIAEFLHRGGIPVVLPLSDTGGRYFFFQQGSYLSLFPVVDGTVVQPPVTEQTLASMGRMLARLHLLTRDGCPFKSAVEQGWDKAGFLTRAMSLLAIAEAKEHKTRLDFLAMRSLKVKIDLAERRRLSYKDLELANDHLVHGDYHEYNVFLDSANQVNSIVDLDKAGAAPRALDLARAINLVCLKADFTDSAFARAAIFAEAYRDIYPLPKDEFVRAMVAYAERAIHSCWMETRHYSQINDNRRCDTGIETEAKRIEYLSNHIEAVAQRLSLAVAH